MRHNNPINVALWNCDLIWPQGTPKDVVLSIGTGTVAAATTPQTTSPEQAFSSKFIPRLCRSFLTSLDGELTWKHLLNHLDRDAEKRYFRLNVNIKGSEPALDDLKAMDRLSREVNTSTYGEQVSRVKLALLASCFFFELKQAPRFDQSGFYICQGEIRTRIDFTKVSMALRQTSAEPVEFYKDQLSLGPVDRSTDICSGCYRFRKKVCFFVRHPAEAISLTVQLGDERRDLSGFPQTMAWIAAAQNLTSPFYTEGYSNAPETVCPCFELIDISKQASRRKAGVKRTTTEALAQRRFSKR